MKINRENYQILVRGTDDGGFRIYTDFDGDHKMVFPENESLTLEEALAVTLDAQERYGLREEQILFSINDIYYTKDRSRSIEKIREAVRQNPEIMAAIEKTKGWKNNG